jgi:hypothetical protein
VGLKSLKSLNLTNVYPNNNTNNKNKKKKNNKVKSKPLELRSRVKICIKILGYDHVVLLLALIKLDYNLTSRSWHSSSGHRGRKRTYRTILEWADHALFKMVRYVLLRPLRPGLDGQDVEVRL